MPWEKLFSLLAISPLSIAILVAFWKGDDAIGSELKADLTRFLQNLPTIFASEHWPRLVADIYDRAFGAILSLHFFLTSAVISLLSFWAIYFAFQIGNPDIDFFSFFNYPDTRSIILVIVFANIIPDYFSNISTRLIVLQWERFGIGSITALFVDFVLTLSIFLFCISLFATVVDGGAFLGNLSDAISVLLGKPIVGNVATVFYVILLTTFCTSIWIWLLLSLSFAVRIGFKFSLGRFLEYLLPLEEKPVRSVGVFASFATLIFSLVV